MVRSLGMIAAVLASAVVMVSPLADRVWHRPACGTPTVRLAAADDVLYGTWAGSDPDRCLIVVSRRALSLPPPLLCHVLLHERGHLAGMAHSTNPRSVMYPGLIRDTGFRWRRGGWVRVFVGVDQRCERLYNDRRPRPVRPGAPVRPLGFLGGSVGQTGVTVSPLAVERVERALHER